MGNDVPVLWFLNPYFWAFVLATAVAAVLWRSISKVVDKWRHGPLEDGEDDKIEYQELRRKRLEWEAKWREQRKSDTNEKDHTDPPF